MDHLMMLPIYLLVLLCGIVVGSFLDVCILRIPAGESIVTVPSHCMSCSKRLRWWELIPLFSYLALGGKCSGCHTRVSPQYPIIEATNGALWILVFLVGGFTPDQVTGCLLLSCLLVLSVIDARTKEIPLSLNIFILVLGVARTVINRHDAIDHIIGFASVSVVLLVLFIASGGRAIGGGDIKLMAAAGLFLGWRLNILAFLLGCILGSVIHLLRMKLKGAERALALGPYLSAGIAIAYLWGDALIAWYLSFLSL